MTLRFTDGKDVKVGEILAIGTGKQAEKIVKIVPKDKRENLWTGEKEFTAREFHTTSGYRVKYRDDAPVPLKDNETALGADGHWFYR